MNNNPTQNDTKKTKKTRLTWSHPSTNPQCPSTYLVHNGNIKDEMFIRRLLHEAPWKAPFGKVTCAWNGLTQKLLSDKHDGTKIFTGANVQTLREQYQQSNINKCTFTTHYTFFCVFCATHVEHVDFVLGLGWRFRSIIQKMNIGVCLRLCTAQILYSADSQDIFSIKKTHAHRRLSCHVLIGKIMSILWGILLKLECQGHIR